MREMTAILTKTYETCLARIGGLKFEPLVDRLGIRLAGESVSVPFFGVPHQV